MPSGSEADFTAITVADLLANASSPEQRAILDALPALVFLERAGWIVFANAEARHMMDHDEAEWTPRPIEDVLWGLYAGAAEPQTLLTRTRSGSPFHAAIPNKNGSLAPIEGTYCRGNAPLRAAVIVAQPSGQRSAPRTRLMDDVLASLPEAIAIEHGDRVLYTNPAFTRLFGYSAEEANGVGLLDLVMPEARRSVDVMLFGEQDGATIETVCNTKSGERIGVGLQAAPLLVNGSAAGRVFSFRQLQAAALPRG